LNASEDPQQAALREFVEEIGPTASIGPLKALGEKTGKSAPAVKKAVKKVGNARKRVEKRLGR
jgi:predicted NUDIX family NTP pyrophosphohydrolase